MPDSIIILWKEDLNIGFHARNGQTEFSCVLSAGCTRSQSAHAGLPFTQSRRVLPWPVEAMVYDFLECSDLGQLFWASRTMAATTKRYLNNCKAITFTGSGRAFHLVTVYCNSLRYCTFIHEPTQGLLFLVTENVATLRQFIAPPRTLAFLADLLIRFPNLERFEYPHAKDATVFLGERIALPVFNEL